MTPGSLGRLLAPSSVAVVGATDRPGSYGGQALLNLDAIGFRGEVWAVNPARREVLGRPCVPSLADLPRAVDAALVAIPAAGVPAVIEQAGAIGCGGAVVISAGFAEIDGGEPLQEELVAAANRHALPVCGPNCNGIVSMRARAALWGDVLDPREPGRVALISQSGNVAVNALATRRGLRFHTVIASGNQAVLSAADYLEALADAPELGAVALYLEDDGDARLCDGLAACADAGVRVAVLKVGSSAAGARAAASHSGALAGDQRVFRALVEEAGALWAEDLHELLELAKAAAVPTRPARRGGLAIITCSGGDSAQGADCAARHGLELPELSPATKARLHELLPVAATVANPLDYTTMIWGDRAALAELVRTVGDDPAVGQLLVFFDQPGQLDAAGEQAWRAVRGGLIDGAAGSAVPMIVSATLPELLDDDAAWRFAESGIAAVAGLRAGVRCSAALRTPHGDRERIRAIARAARSLECSGRRSPVWLSEHEAKQRLTAAGVAVVPGAVVTGEDDAALALAELGPPVAIKLSSASVQHKSELGAVLLGLRTVTEVIAAYRRLAPLAERLGGEILIEQMAPAGVELLLAAHADGVVPALVVGLGGLWTELLDDVRIVPLPAPASRIERELRSLRGASLLDGGRGQQPVDVAAAAGLAARIGELLLDSSLALIECNPVRAFDSGAVVLDACVRAYSSDSSASASCSSSAMPMWSANR